MAVSKALERWSLEASEDLSKKQFFVVAVSTTSTLALATSGSSFPVVLEDTPKAKQYGTVVLVGVAKVKVNSKVSEIKAGEKVVVANGGNGGAEPGTVQAASGNAQPIIGTALYSAPAGTLCTILVHSGSGATG